MKENGETQMKRRTVMKGLGLAGMLPAMLGRAAEAAPETGVYELRVYTTYEGKLGDLLKRFREHTTAIFERHGMKNVAYWTPMDESGPNPRSKTLIYILKHPSREAAAANWKAFQDDPEWQQVRAKSEEAGKIVEKVEATFMVLTDFSRSIG
jgi:NIPSNAP